MKARLAILGAIVAMLALALRQNIVVTRREVRVEIPESTGTSARATGTATFAASHARGASRFDGVLAALPATENTDNWTPTLDRLADSVPSDALADSLRELTGAEADSPSAMLRERLLRRWTRLAPEGAAAFVVGITDPAERGEALLQVAVAWAESDLSAAADWVRSLSNESESDELLLQLAHEAVRTEPLRALELSAELPPGPPLDELVAQAAGGWAMRDPQGAAEWARSLSTEGGRAGALESVVVSWAGTDASAAAGFALENLPPGEVLDRVVVAVVQRWAQSDPWSAAGWVEHFGPSGLQRIALDNLLVNWFVNDIQGPAHWIESLQAGLLRDLSAASYARQLASLDEPGQATAWLNLIADTDLRRRAVETIAAFNSTTPAH